MGAVDRYKEKGDKDWGWESENVQVSDGGEEGDSGYRLDRGRRRVSLGWSKGALREMRVVEEIGNEESESDGSSDDESKESGEKRKGGRTLVSKEKEKDSPQSCKEYQEEEGSN